MIVLAARAELFRLLGDEDRLRLLALCSEEELTVGELAHLLGESQPQITKKTQPLREAGLLASRRDGTRTLLKTSHDHGVDEVADVTDPVIAAALAEGRALCAKDGSLAKIQRVIAAREETSRRLFDEPQDAKPAPAADSTLLGWLPMIAPLLPSRGLAVDIGTGEGTLLALLSPLYDRVIGVDRSAARLARAGANIEAWGLPNVRLREGAVDDPALVQEIMRVSQDVRRPDVERSVDGRRTDGDVRAADSVLARGAEGATTRGADLVVMARVLVHAARPQDVIASAAHIVRPGGYLLLIDYLPHDDESLREQGHVWLGFEPGKLRAWLEAAKLQPVALHPFSQPLLQLAVARKPGDHHGHSH